MLSAEKMDPYRLTKAGSVPHPKSMFESVHKKLNDDQRSSTTVDSNRLSGRCAYCTAFVWDCVLMFI